MTSWAGAGLWKSRLLPPLLLLSAAASCASTRDPCCGAHGCPRLCSAAGRQSGQVTGTGLAGGRTGGVRTQGRTGSRQHGRVRCTAQAFGVQCHPKDSLHFWIQPGLGATARPPQARLVGQGRPLSARGRLTSWGEGRNATSSHPPPAWRPCWLPSPRRAAVSLAQLQVQRALQILGLGSEN